jgi:RNA polymerase sigma factor (sigma-70 family)
MDDSKLHLLVRRAQSGDAAALEEVVRAVQDDVFDLALRMLGDATDARDASQEVLVRIVTKLGTFHGDSRFRTWVYRVAANALLNFRAGLRRREIPFEQAEEQLQAAVAAWGEAPLGVADRTLVNEVKLVCAHGLLLSLDRPHRLAYVLGEVLELSSEEGAAVLEISPAAFRKRLSRARADMEAFLRKNCGLADPGNACRCAKLLPLARSAGLVDPERPVMTSLPTRRADRLHVEVQQIRTAAEVFRAMPKYAAPSDFAASLRALLNDEASRPLLGDDQELN